MYKVFAKRDWPECPRCLADLIRKGVVKPIGQDEFLVKKEELVRKDLTKEQINGLNYIFKYL